MRGLLQSPKQIRKMDLLILDTISLIGDSFRLKEAIQRTQNRTIIPIYIARSFLEYIDAQDS